MNERKQVHRLAVYLIFGLAVLVTVLAVRLRSNTRAPPPRAAPVPPIVGEELGTLAAELNDLLSGSTVKAETSVGALGERVIKGIVIDAQTRKPVGAAAVYLAVAGEVYAPIGSDWPFVSTAENGHFELPLSDTSLKRSNLVVLALKSGFGPGKYRFLSSSVPKSITVTLDRGLTITGVVTTSAGRPVSNAMVLATGPHAKTATMRLNSRMGDLALDRSFSMAYSGRNGRFEIGGLENVVYLVRAQRNGFAPPPSLQFTEVSPSADKPETLLLDPLAGVWVRLIDQLSGQPVHAWGGVRIEKGVPGAREILPWYPPYDPWGWSGEHPWHPGEFRAVYVIADPRLLNKTEELVLRIEKPGFQSTSVKARLRPVQNWSGATPDIYHLSRSQGAQFGTMRLRIRNFPSDARPLHIPLAVERQGKRLTFSAQWREKSQYYESTLIPAGTYKLMDFVGGQGVVVPPNGLADVAVSFPRLKTTGITCVLLDKRRGPVTHASFALVSNEGKVVASWEPRMGFRDGRQAVANIDPGRYTIIVHKTGYRQVERIVDIVAATNEEIEIVLTPDSE